MQKIFPNFVALSKKPQLQFKLYCELIKIFSRICCSKHLSLKQFIFTDTSFNNDEWNQFLDSELNNSDIDSDFSKVNANDLAVLVKPLQTSKSSTEVINKTVTALSKPFLQVILNEMRVMHDFANLTQMQGLIKRVLNNF